MNRDFWLGVLAVPGVLAVCAAGVAVVAGLAWFSISVCRFNEWKLAPRKFHSRATLAAVVANAKWTRYMWIPGWHIVIARTGLATRETEERSRRHSRIRDAILRAYRDLQDSEQ